MGLLSAVASVFVAYAYTPVLSSYIKNKYLIGKITEGINETLKSLSFDTETELYNLDKLAAELPEPFTGILERYGIEIDSFAKKLVGMTSCGENTIYNISEEIADPTAEMIASALSFIIIFIAVFLVLAIVTSLLDLIFKLPVLKTANMFFGFVFGALEAVVFVSALALLASVLVTAMGSIDPDLFGKKAIDETIICKYLIEHNILSKVLS